MGRETGRVPAAAKAHARADRLQRLGAGLKRPARAAANEQVGGEVGQSGLRGRLNHGPRADDARDRHGVAGHVFVEQHGDAIVKNVAVDRLRAGIAANTHGVSPRLIIRRVISSGCTALPMKSRTAAVMACSISSAPASGRCASRAAMVCSRRPRPNSA